MRVIVLAREKLASVEKVSLCILSLDSMELCMFNVSMCLSVKFKCQIICHLCQHQCLCQISNNGLIKCILSYLSYNLGSFHAS